MEGVDIANLNGVKIGTGGSKTIKVKSINDLANLVRVDQRVPIPTPEREISEAKYKAAIALKKDREAKVAELEAQKAKLYSGVVEPTRPGNKSSLAERTAWRDAHDQYKKDKEAADAKAKTVQDRIKALVKLIDGHDTTITQYESQ